MSTMLHDTMDVEAELSDAELIAECKARSGIYRLLSGAFYEEPSIPYLQAIRAPEVSGSLRAMGVLFGPDVTEVALETLQDALACEYTDLFVVSGGCPAVESVRLTGRYQQQPYFEARDFYAKNGFVLSDGKHKVFEDQLGVELLFVAEMLARAAGALEAGDRTAHTSLTKEIKRFWALHPGKWVRGYAQLLARAANHSFYREMAQLLGNFTEWELHLLGVKVEDIDQGKLEVPKADIEYDFDLNEPVCNACDKGDKAEDLDAMLQTIDISLIEKRIKGSASDSEEFATQHTHKLSNHRA